jgi:hypothetical protein
VDTYVACAKDLTAVNDNMVGPFFEAVLSDYRQGVDIAKDAEVLSVLATMVGKLGVSILFNKERQIQMPTDRISFAYICRT